MSLGMTLINLDLFDREIEWILASFFMRFSGTLSFVGSTIIIYMILSDRRIKLKRIHNRILLGMSTIEIFNSAAWIMSVSAAPKGTPGSYGAAGNNVTCTLQGFLIQLGFGVPFYNLSLCLYHCLVIRFNVTDATITKRLEPFLHAVPVLFPLTTALSGIPLEFYNFKGAICYIESSPWACRYGGNCTRNPHSLVFEFWLAGFWLILIGCSVIVFMTLVYCSVRQRERAMSQFNFRTRDGTVVLSSSYIQLCKDKRETGIQAFLYVAAFIITYLWSGINYFFTVAGSTPPDALKLLIFLFTPLQGFWNFFIYIRPRYCLINRQFRDKSIREKLVLVIFYPETGRRNSSLDGPRIQPRSATVAANTTSRLALVQTKNSIQTIPQSKEKDIENSGMMDDDSPIESYNHATLPLTQEEHCALEYSDNETKVAVIQSTCCHEKDVTWRTATVSMESNSVGHSKTDSDPSNYRLGHPMESTLEVNDSHPRHNNNASEMNEKSRRRASHFAIAFIDNRYEVSNEDDQVRFPARRRRSLISIALEDEILVDDGDNDDASTLGSQKAPRRRRSLISISLDDMNEILAEDQENLLEE